MVATSPAVRRMVTAMAEAKSLVVGTDRMGRLGWMGQVLEMNSINLRSRAPLSVDSRIAFKPIHFHLMVLVRVEKILLPNCVGLRRRSPSVSLIPRSSASALSISLHRGTRLQLSHRPS